MAENDAPQGVNDATKVTSQVDGQKETDWKAEARKWEARAKQSLADAEANKDAAKRLADIEESKKTVEQKMTDRISALEAELSKSQHEGNRARIQAKYKLSDDDAELFLTATDTEGLEKQAKAIADRIADRKAKGPVVPSQKGGDEKTPKADPLRDLARQVFNSES